MGIPAELLNYRQWVLWRRIEVNGRQTKVPISPWSGKVAACDKPQTWSTYRHVRYASRRYACDGVGFVFTESDPFCGIDLDKCRVINGVITAEAMALIKTFGSYTELSPSGTGVHILIRAKLAGKGRRTGQTEMYDSGRYFTVTGNHIARTPFTINSRQETLDRFAAEIFRPAVSMPIAVLPALAKISDEELVNRAKNARNGELFKRLWAGDASDYGHDRSRADLALCRMLAFWCGGDYIRVDRLFRVSGLMRDKWDRRTGDSAYGVLTLRAALNHTQKS